MLIEPYATAVRPHPQLVSAGALCPADPATAASDALALFTPWAPAAAAAANPYAAVPAAVVPPQQPQQQTALFRPAAATSIHALRAASLLHQQVLMKMEMTTQSPLVSTTNHLPCDDVHDALQREKNNLCSRRTAEK